MLLYLNFMCSICPKTCEGLAIAAVFIAAGVVQLISGLILIRSKYVYMLSAPDFWTAISNIAAGCLLGVAASVWRSPRTKKTYTVIARYNLIVALLVSSVAVNATTCTILILSEGSTLLSIHLEKNGKHNLTLNSELLGYAYAASVISPAICITVALIALIIRCCPTRKIIAKRSKPSSKNRRKNLHREDSKLYQWVFTTPERAQDATPAPIQIFSSSSSEFDSSPIVASLAFSSPSTTESWQNVGLQPSVHSCEQDCDRALETLNETDICGQSLDQSLTPTVTVGEVVPVQLGSKISHTKYRCGMTVTSPHAPDRWNTETLVKTPIRATSSLKPISNRTASDLLTNYNLGKTLSSFSPFYDERFKTEFEFLRRCPQVKTVSQLCSREDHLFKLASIASITESLRKNISTRTGDSRLVLSPAHSSGYCSSPDNAINAPWQTTPAVDYPGHLNNDTTPKAVFI